MGEGRLNIGPIGVEQKTKWKPPGEWYEDDDHDNLSSVSLI